MIRAIPAAGLLVIAGLALDRGHARADESAWKALPDRVAEHHGWSGRWIDTGEFRLLSYLSPSRPGDGLLSVYIEGDGRPWETRTRISDDPTPRSAMTLEMAVRDPEAAAYLARPCHFLPEDALAQCPSRHWSLARYGEAAVRATDRAIDILKAETPASELRLVGFSGGAQLALLVAARRDDVVELVTVAGNLDHRAWTDRLGVTPLRDSLNAADIARDIEHIPQVHYVAESDDIVTRAEVEAYLANMTRDGRGHLVVVPGFGHNCCWTERWTKLLEDAEALMRR